MGFFSETELASLKIKEMSLHVVTGGSFQREAARKIEHSDFFLERIRDTNVAPVFSFKEISGTRSILEDIAAFKTDFEKGAQDLAYHFNQDHEPTSKEGALFIFELRTDNPTVKIYSLIKYDYREVIEQKEDDESGVELRRIVQAFVADKRAMQKSALVRIVDGKADEAVSARDQIRSAPEIADYFRKFLGVERNLNDEDLNRRALEVVRTTLERIKELLPKGGVPRAFSRAKDTLRSRSMIDETAMAEAIVDAADHPEDEGALARIHTVVRRRFQAEKLSGLSFKPDPKIMTKPALRRVKTKEGANLTYPGDLDGTFVTRTPAPSGKGEIITIRTDQIMEDDVVRESSRRATG